MTTSPWTTRYYARVPTQFLGRLLSRAAGGSAIHKAIRDEIRRRAVNKAPRHGDVPAIHHRRVEQDLKRITFTSRERTSESSNNKSLPQHSLRSTAFVLHQP